jgi:hypothetical protein
VTHKSSRLLALLAITLCALGACRATEATEAPLDTPPPGASPEASPTPGDALLTVPNVGCCRGRVLPAGRYALPAWLELPLTVEIGDGWRALNESPARLFLLGRGENVQDNPSQMIVFINATGKGSPDALVASLQGEPGLRVLAEPVSVEVAGFPGLQLDTQALPNPTFEGNPGADIPPGVQPLPVITAFFTPGFTWTTSSPEARVRALVLTAADQTLLLYLEAPPEEFEAFAADAGQLLESLALIEP